MYEHIFTPCKIGNLEIKNRIVLEPMGNCYSNEKGEATPREAWYYAERAKGGTGLVMTECVTVAPGLVGGGNTHQMTLCNDDVIPGMKKLTDAVHQYDAAVMCEIYHSGRQGIAAPGGTVAAPSVTECQAVHQPTHEMTIDEIHEMERYFVDAAIRCEKSGFDGVVVHGAHGYLICSFLSPYTNLRTDEYGGSTENRFRFLGNIIKGIREALPDYPIVVRFSVDEYLRINGVDDGIVLEEGIEIAKMIEAAGADAIDVSAGIYETMNVAWEPVGYQQGWKVDNVAAVKAAVNIPVIGCTVVRDPAYAEMMVAEGKADFVGTARQLLADAEWCNKAKDSRAHEIRKCISCLNCMEVLMTDNPVTCAVNPEAGMEEEYSEIACDGAGRTVVVVGSGPAGMAAAQLLARREFKVIVLEARAELGGQMNYANKPPMKDKITWFIDYMKAMTVKYGIEVRLDVPASLEVLKEIDPYAIIWAAGSTPVKPRAIAGLDLPCVVTPPEVLTGEVKFFGKKICIVGSGMTGIEVAEMLADQGNEVEVYEMADEIGPGMHFQNLIDVMGRIAPHGVGMFPKSQLMEVRDGEADFKSTETGEIATAKFDYLVCSLGVRPNGIPEDIAAAYPNIVNVGDSEKTGRIQHATSTGYAAAFNLK